MLNSLPPLQMPTLALARHARLGGDVPDVLLGRLHLANDVVAEVAGGAFGPVGHRVFIH